MTPIFQLILIPKFHSSTQLYGYHNLDILIAFPIIAMETFLSGSPDFMEETLKKKIKRSLKAETKYVHVSIQATREHYFGKPQA